MGKWLIHLAVFPAVIVLTILKWGGTYTLQVVRILCMLISRTIFVLTVVAYIVGLAPRDQTANAFVAGIVFYLVPRIGGIMVSSVVLTNAVMKGLIIS